MSSFEAVPQLHLDASPEGIMSGESTTLTWSVIDAEACIKSGDWNGAAIAGTGIYTETVVPAILPASFSMQCSNQHGDSPIRTALVEDIRSELPALLLTANPTTLTSPGEMTTVTWMVSDADNCVASVTAGLASPWNGVVSSTNGVHSQAVWVNALPAELSLDCINAVGQVSQSVTIVEDVNPGNPPTLTLVANPSTINQGDLTTLTWSANNAISCTASSNPFSPSWQGSRAVVGSQQLAGLNVTTTFSMVCSNSFGTVTQHATVFVNNPMCGANQPPVGTFRYQDMTSFEDAVGSQFGHFTGHVANYLQPTGSYSALVFTAPAGSLNGRVIFEEPGPIYPRANSTSVSISACPGDFDMVAGNCTHDFFGNTGTFRWSTDPSADPQFYCILEPGMSYYMNIIHAHLSDLSNSSCADENGCGLLFAQFEN